VTASETIKPVPRTPQRSGCGFQQRGDSDMSQLDWKADYAYTTGMQAFINGFPYVYSATLRHGWVTQARDPAVIPYAAVNCFCHAARVLDATYRDGGCPTNDTLYSPAWPDLGGEPVILSHPDIAGRYLTFELMGFHLRQGQLRRAARHHRRQGRAFRHLRAGLAPGSAARGPGDARSAAPGGEWPAGMTAGPEGDHA
jgi:hypothetical protein